MKIMDKYRDDEVSEKKSFYITIGDDFYQIEECHLGRGIIITKCDGEESALAITPCYSNSIIIK